MKHEKAELLVHEGIVFPSPQKDRVLLVPKRQSLFVGQKWEIWVKNRNALEKDFKHYLKRETIREGATKIEVEGHFD